MIWANLLHLNINMWWDRETPELAEYLSLLSAKPYLRFEKSLWDDILDAMVDAGMNMVIIDLADGVRYKSHPEIAVENAWSVDYLREELAKIRKMGLEPIPKLNFSATHDVWLGVYSRMLSTPRYYDVCRDLIGEVIDIFDKPRFFHLGMDEETADHQAHQEYVVVRQYDLWWRDLLFYVDEVEKRGVRPWVWSDYLWHHPDEYFKRMPKSVLQSNWYYEAEFSPFDEQRAVCVDAYRKLDEQCYDQVPTGSNWSTPVNFRETVKFSLDNIAPDQLKGFIQAPWRPTMEPFRQKHMEAINQVKNVRVEFERNTDV